MDKHKESLFETIGGEEVLDKWVEAFYRHVKAHPVIAHLFPDDLSETVRKQKQFLTQFLGGPPLYSTEHGHPMLRRRHLRFPIGNKEASAWLSCMRSAMAEAGLSPENQSIIFDRLSRTAYHMVNQPFDRTIRGVDARDTL
ncbi:globin [Sporolactobacillus sp. THM7-7]|nr:globin [Sporolactobacillus sp. THM7-7]